MRKTAMAAAILGAAAFGKAGFAQPTLQAVSVAQNLDQPTFVTGAPGDLNHLYITEKGTNGTASIKVLDLTTKTVTNFLTISNVATDSEEGLLGLAFDPNYASNGDFYVDYVSTGGTAAGFTNITEFHANSALSANPTAVGTLLSFNQPETNHNGGWIGFSPRAGDDHNLYIATGDGGNANDQGFGHIEPGGNAQSTATDLGKILRIHVNPTNGTFTIPSNNPFANSSDPSVKKEIYALGLRNPFRDSFDPVTGTLYIGDVGQDTREELDVQKASNPGGGENYGWRLREGTITTPTGSPVVGGAKPPGAIDPILDYAHDPGVTTLAGQTIIGGYVYRGSAIPGLDGTYIFGDYLGPETTGGRTEVFSLNYDGSTVSSLTDLTSELNPGATPLITNISSFGVDTAGEMYIVDIGSGQVFKIVGVPEPAALAMLGVGSLALFAKRRRVR